MNEMTRLVQNHDYLTPRIAGKSGISKFKFYKYVRENGLEPVSRGVYSTGADWVDELYVLHKRCPNAVFSHDEAFYYHGLTDREPFVHTLTIYSGYNAKEKFMQRSVRDSERPQRKLIFIKIENPISPHFPKFFGKGSTIYI